MRRQGTGLWTDAFSATLVKLIFWFRAQSRQTVTLWSPVGRAVVNMIGKLKLNSGARGQRCIPLSELSPL